MFLSWILSYQDLHMIAFPGLIISILSRCRITYSLLAHFYLVHLSLKSSTLISFQPCLHSSTSYLHRYSSYCGSVTIYLHRYSSYCGSVSTHFFHWEILLNDILVAELRSINLDRSTLAAGFGISPFLDTM